MGEGCGTGGDGGGAGGGGSGGCGGEHIGVAVEASTGCCCEVPVDGSPGRCRDVAGPDGCTYGSYTDGVCNTGVGGCSASGIHSGAGGANVVDGVVLLLTLVALRTLRRRFA